jgi:hypothetical protein
MTDNSPQLGGQSDDLSPMISSVQTRVIADARGAYLAGNLRTLVDSMTEQQAQTFKHALIQFAWDSIAATLDQVRDEDRFTPNLYDEVYLVRDWLVQPRSETLDAIEQVLLAYDHQVHNYEHCLYELLKATWQEPIRDFLAAPYAVAYGCWQGSRAGSKVLITCIERWQLEMAWAIHRGLSLPPYPRTDSAAVELALTDLPRMYHERNFKALVLALTPGQLAQFRIALINEGTRRVREMLTPAQHSEIHQIFDDLVAWRDDPSHPTEEETDQFRERMKTIHRHDSAYQVMWPLIGLFEDTWTAFQSNVEETTGSATSWLANIQGYWAETQEHIRVPPGQIFSTWVWRFTFEWCVETAWAILHDDPVPPLELMP